MELDRTIWKPLSTDFEGMEISLRLIRRSDDWVNPLTHQTFLPVGLGAACGLCLSLHSWQLGRKNSEGAFLLHPLPTSKHVIEPPKRKEDFFRLSEVCAGLGGISHGGFMTGIEPHVALEISTFSCAHLAANFYPRVVQGDVSCKADVGLFHQAMAGLGSGLAAGFPCQPFSSMGAMHGFSDPRASIYFRILDVAYLTQCSFLLLECVPGVSGLRPITDAMDRFCEVMHFQWRTTILHLDRALPSRRTRWWLLALPKDMSLPVLRDLPLSHDRQRLGQVITSWPLWPLEEEQELQLSQAEQDMHHDSSYGVVPRLLDINSAAPTLLHSAAHHLVDCPCGCRGPISDATLRARGWQATLVQSRYPLIGLRHLHHNEAAFLVGAPFGLVALEGRKALLPLLGQIASPIQAHWILVLMQEANGLLGDLTPEQAHERIVLHHVDDHLRQWPTRSHAVPRPVSIAIEHQPPMQVTLHQTTSIRTLLDATGHLIGEHLELDPPDAAWLHPQGYVPPGPVSIRARLVGQGRKPFTIDMDEPAVLVPREGLDDYTIHYQAMRLFAKSSCSQYAFFTPRFVSHVLEVWPHFAQLEILRALEGKQAAIGVLWDLGHWIAFRVERQGDQLKATSFDGLSSEVTADLTILFQRFQYALSCASVSVDSHCIVPQTGGTHCGAIALLHVGFCLGLWDACDETTAQLWNEVLFQRQLRRGGGPTKAEAIQAWLENFLPTKGVPIEAAKSRASAAIKKLGIDALDSAISTTDPWRALKQAGGALSKPFQWVQYEELQAHIAKRSEVRYGTAAKQVQHGNRGKRVETLLNITPATLELLPNTFFDAADEPLGMISLQTLRPDQRGIAIVTEEEALAFLKDRKNLSTDAFGLLTIGELANPDADSRIEHIHWSAVYKPTQEPIIIRGSLVSLGDISIEKKTISKALTMPKVDTEVIRIQAFADATDTWEDLQSGPVKHIIALIPALRFCTEESCSGACGLFHPAVDEKVQQVVLDAWAWKWLTAEGKKSTASKAEAFSVYMRVPASALRQILKHSGDHGIFVEPRPESMQGSHPSYCVVWLSRTTSHSEALHYKRTQDLVVGLARMGQKLGLRALLKHEAALLKIVYPDRAFASCQVRFIYETGPVPHALSRDQVAQMLKAWGWIARPLKAFRSTADGKFWDIGTSTAPPAPILETEHGDLTVAKKRDAEKTAKVLPIVSAPKRTSDHMKASFAGKSSVSAPNDIWLKTGG